MNPSILELIASVLFGLAILHTFSVKRFEHWAKNYPEGSVGENFFHFLGEVEVVFGLWAIILVTTMMVMFGNEAGVNYLEGSFTLAGAKEPIHINFNEPLFVIAIMTMAATRPILEFTSKLIEAVSKTLPLPSGVGFYVTALVLGPLLGSLITEPAAMTVTALLLKKKYYDQGISKKLMYATIGLLFVNVSIGGTLTNFAAPPVLMVAHIFDLDTLTMLTHFGWKAASAIIVSTLVVTYLFRKELTTVKSREKNKESVPITMMVIHILFMTGVVYFSHHMVMFMMVFLLFLGFVEVTQEYQSELKLREALLVGFFLMGLVILGGLQRWWLEPTIGGMSEFPLYAGTSALTAITDNAALTYLGSQVPHLSEASQYALVAGAVTGGGLTVIANAPNPAGFGILKSSFGDEGISPLGLLIAAIGPTLVAALCFWFLPNLG